MMNFKDKVNELIARYRTPWKVFISNGYGKVGLYIVIFFVVVAMLSPVLVSHDPMVYTVPPEDSFVSNQLFAIPLNTSGNNTLYSTFGSASNVEGCFLDYYASQAGKLYGLGLGGTSSTSVNRTFFIGNISLHGGVLMQPSSFTLVNYADELSGFFVYHTFLLFGTSTGSICVFKIGWTGLSAGVGNPQISGASEIALNGSLVHAPVAGAPCITNVFPTYVPEYGSDTPSPSTGGSPGYIYAVSHSSGRYYLNAFYAFPLKLAWEISLPGLSTPSEPAPYGYMQDVASHDSVIVSQGSTVLSYSSRNGSLLWEDNLSETVNVSLPFKIPINYQELLEPYNGIFVTTSSPNEIFELSANNGSVTKIFETPLNIIGESVSSGSSGFPSDLVVQTPTRIYFLGGPMSILKGGNITLPTGFGQFNQSPKFLQSKDEFLIASSEGYVIAYSGALGQYPAQWHANPVFPVPRKISNLSILLDSGISDQSFGYVTSSGIIVMYSSSPININPLPPTLHSLSGTVLLLGTNSFGNDLWSQFIASFTFSWYLGIVIGVTTIVLATIMAMLVGFLGGAPSSALEYFSLALFLIPGLPLLIALVSVLKLGMTGVILVIALLGWPFTAFTLIGVVKSTKTRTFITSSKVSGISTMGILRRHMLPNMTPLLLYFMAGAISSGVGAVSTLQFIGVAPLTIATWGAMLAPTLSNFFVAASAPWWVIPPATALTLFVVGFVFISRGMDEVVNPRLRKR